MATLPRSSGKSTLLNRPNTQDFDSGVNSSTAWTESNNPSVSLLRPRKYLSESDLRQNGSLSDDELDDGPEDETHSRSARALYGFQGKAEFRELDVEAGDEISVLKEDVGEGWSLVKNANGEIGLLPQTYYTFTSEFSPAPDLEIDNSPNGKQYPKRKEATNDSVTPRGSPRNSQAPSSPPLIPQNTGEWTAAFPSFRHSLLGGKSLNRFSAFVTSGAEEFVLKGSPTDSTALDAATSNPPEQPLSGHTKEDSSDSFDEDEQRKQSRLEADRHFVSSGPSWKEKVPPFRILVHSPSKRSSMFSGAYTVYSVTSFFHAPQSEGDEDDLVDPEDPIASVTVQRRFSHFVILHTALTRRLPGIALPPLPEKQYAGRFSDDFVEARRGDLERYINKVIRHPVARYAEMLTFFLSCESDSEWKRQVPEHLSMPPAGPSFYARVYHPAYNLDKDDAANAIDLFDNHTKAVGTGVQNLRGIFSKIREARIDMSRAERLLSYSFLSLITGKPLASSSSSSSTEPADVHATTSIAKGLVNEAGAWCWRENCEDCLKLTKAIQKTSETLQNVADLYDDHARRTQLSTHESMKTMAHPAAIYEGIISTHRSTLSRFNEAVYGTYPDDDVANRCETVLNITMAEMDTYHNQKFEDFQKLVTEHLDGEIQVYEQILTRLYLARRNFDSPEFDELGSSPGKSSIYERELANPKLTPSPLTQPCPHVYDSTPMRPVSVAVQEGVNMLLSSAGRGSVFSKFWH
ncbi:hypothetical protein H1R20_g9926, partial [Candolleomyces eurysporus]